MIYQNNISNCVWNFYIFIKCQIVIKVRSKYIQDAFHARRHFSRMPTADFLTAVFLSGQVSREMEWGCTVSWNMNKFEHVWGRGGGQGSVKTRARAWALTEGCPGHIPSINRQTQLKTLHSCISVCRCSIFNTLEKRNTVVVRPRHKNRYSLAKIRYNTQKIYKK